MYPRFNLIAAVLILIGAAVFASSACRAEEGVLETYMKKAVDSVAEGQVQQAMTNLRIGINSGVYSPKLPSDEFSKTLATAIESQKDAKKKAALLVIQSVLFIVTPGKRDAAKTALDDAEKLDGSLPEIFNTRAILLITEGKQGDALANLNKAIELNGTYVDAIKNRANLYQSMKEPEKAVQDSIRYQTLLGEINYKKK